MNTPDRVNASTPRHEIGLVDGSMDATTRRFSILLDDDAVVQLDDLVEVSQPLPDGRSLAHYAIVVEGFGRIEGAQLPADTRRIAGERTMPGETVRRVEAQVLRTVPELWLPPAPGSVVRRAVGVHRDNALFADQMEQKLPVGLDQSGQPVYADWSFINGEKGGHISISGISGVATKTSYALFLLYMLFETEQGRELLGQWAPQTRALVLSVKGEDALHLDRPNARFKSTAGAAEGWQNLGVGDPGSFERVRLYAPRSAAARPGAIATDVKSRPAEDLVTYGWSPQQFIRKGLLKFCFSDTADARSQVSYVEQRVRVQLARWAHPLEGEPGAVVLCEPVDSPSFNLERIAELRRAPRRAEAGWPVRSFSDLVDFLTEILSPEDGQGAKPGWTAGVQEGTVQAFLRRLYAQVPRLGHLISTGVQSIELEEPITVVDIHSLHEDAQRFVVGSLLSEIFESKQGQGRQPLRFVLLDELNKYAPREGNSPIKEILVDIAQRGRSLGVLLIGAQQAASQVEPALISNAALKVVGRLDAGEADAYRFLSNELRERASRFLPGTMVLDQPLIPAPLPIHFPFPAFATSVGEDAGLTGEARTQAEADAFARVMRSST